MKKFNFLSIFLIATLFAINVNGQFSRQQAIDLVLNDVLSDDVGSIDVFSSLNSVTTSVDLIDNDNVTNPYSESWVFFSDDSPFAAWYHGSRVIFVSTDDGSYTITAVEIYPKGLYVDYEDISSADRPTPISMDGTAFVPDPEKVLSNYNYALIIVSMDNPRNWYNTSLIYNVLLQNYNYQKDNIIVLYSWDGNSNATDYLNDLDGLPLSNDLDGEATWDNIQSTITNLTTDLGHGDQLAVFFTGVPVDKTLAEPRFGFFDDADGFMTLYPVSGLSEPMEDIDCGQMILNFDVNSASDVSAYFEATGNPNALCQNRYLTGSTGSNEENYAEMYFSTGKYSEQLFYWASAARGFLPEVGAPWNTILPAIGYENGGGFPYHTIEGLENHLGDNILDNDNDSFIQMDEAFEYADDMNTWTAAYYYNPYGGNLEFETPHQKKEIPFDEYLITLSGLSGHITHNPQTIPARSYIVAD